MKEVHNCLDPKFHFTTFYVIKEFPINYAGRQASDLLCLYGKKAQPVSSYFCLLIIHTVPETTKTSRPVNDKVSIFPMAAIFQAFEADCKVEMCSIWHFHEGVCPIQSLSTQSSKEFLIASIWLSVSSEHLKESTITCTGKNPLPL